MELKSDRLWEVFEGAKSFEEFKLNILQGVYLKPQIPEDIKSEIALIEKLLLHSYFEYHFIDLALSQAIFTLEKCIRIRYTEVTGKASKKLSFSELIDWCFENNYFETTNKDVLSQLRNIRNDKVHSEQKSLGGIAFLKKIYSVFYFINDLYEDSSLRVSRRETINHLQIQLNNLLKDGGIITIGNKRTIVFKADVIFLNNKQSPPLLTLVFWPIFNPKDFENDKLFKPFSFEIEISNWQFSEDSFSALNTADGNTITITKISDEVNSSKFDDWRHKFHNLKNFSLILFLTYELNDNFFSALNKFHSTEVQLPIK